MPDHAVRIVTVKATPHRSGGKTGGGSTGPNGDGSSRIATNRLDLPAELIGEIYRLRWMIETFFRMFKQLPGCRHLLSIKRAFEMVRFYLSVGLGEPGQNGAAYRCTSQACVILLRAGRCRSVLCGAGGASLADPACRSGC